MESHTSERLVLTNQLIELQARAQNDDTKRHIEVVLERLSVLDGFELSISGQETKKNL